MENAVLNIKTKLGLIIKVDEGKNFSVLFEGFDNLDTNYTLSLVSETNKENKVDFSVANGGVVLEPIENKLTLIFSGEDFYCGKWEGTLQSENKDAAFFYSNEIKLLVG